MSYYIIGALAAGWLFVLFIDWLVKNFGRYRSHTCDPNTASTLREAKAASDRVDRMLHDIGMGL